MSSALYISAIFHANHQINAYLFGSNWVDRSWPKPIPASHHMPSHQPKKLKTRTKLVNCLRMIMSTMLLALSRVLTSAKTASPCWCHGSWWLCGWGTNSGWRLGKCHSESLKITCSTCCWSCWTFEMFRDIQNDLWNCSVGLVAHGCLRKLWSARNGKHGVGRGACQTLMWWNCYSSCWRNMMSKSLWTTFDTKIVCTYYILRSSSYLKSQNMHLLLHINSPLDWFLFITWIIFNLNLLPRTPVELVMERDIHKQLQATSPAETLRKVIVSTTGES